MNFNDQLTEIISDPFDGPFEGEDYFINEEGIINIPIENIKLSAIVMRKVNSSGIFEKKLVKVGQGGDNILLGFDTLVDTAPVYSAKIGFKGDTVAEVKADEAGKFCVYVNKKRLARMFKKQTSAKQFIKQLDKELQSAVDMSENVDD